MAVNLTQYATSVDASGIYSESQEMTSFLPLTTWTPYNFVSVYAVTMQGLQPTDKVHCEAEAEVTNNLGYDVQVDKVIAADVTNEAFPNNLMDKLRSQNVTPDVHHMDIDASWTKSGYSGTVTFSLVLIAASTKAQQGDELIVEKGYGSLQCYVVK